MNIYHYDAVASEYLGVSQAKLDPLDKLPRIPAHATTDKPSAPLLGSVMIFSNGAWSEAVDNRGTIYYDGDENPIEITGIGAPIPDGSSPIPVLTPVTVSGISKLQAVRYWQGLSVWADIKAMLKTDADLSDRWDAASTLLITDPDVVALGAGVEAVTGKTLQVMFNEAFLL